jgi:asparagine synthase (glutamine-hydrolysing)
MCGILAALGVTGDAETNRRDILKLSRLLRHRGPDQNDIYQSPDGKAFIAFERLTIVDTSDTGRCAMHGLHAQPNSSPTPAAPCILTRRRIPPSPCAQATVQDRDARGQHQLGTVSVGPYQRFASPAGAPSGCALARPRRRRRRPARRPRASCPPPAACRRNSEIYNHQKIRDTALAGITIPSKSDSSVVGYLYQKYGDTNDLWNSLDGIFACVVWDERSGSFCAARDPLGICSLYWGKGADGSVWFASEMKALLTKCTWIDIFPPVRAAPPPPPPPPPSAAHLSPRPACPAPSLAAAQGHVYRSSTGKLERWFQPAWLSLDRIPSGPADLPLLRQTFINAVVKRLMSDAPLAILLSGGLDSSLVASVAVRHIREATNAGGVTSYDPAHKLHTFSIGIGGSPDLVAARRVAAYLGTVHHEFTFTVEEGIDALGDLIWHIESYEQVRAAVPMYLLARRIKALGIKVVLSGEGADEELGGYLYFHKAPSPAEYHRECVRLVARLHQWDVLRANKAPFAFGVETRVPFLDKEFLEVAMNIDAAHKMPNLAERPDGVHAKLEKYILRKAFDTPEEPYLPEEVLWRQKEQFSDGVGYDWVDGLKAHAGRVVTDEMWAARGERFPEHTPRTREYYLLRSLFESHFPHPCALDTVPKGLSIACSTPEALAWDPEWADSHEISGRAIKAVHDGGAGFEEDGAAANGTAA